MRQHGTDELDRPDQVGGDHVIDLLVGELLSRAEQAVAGVAYDHVDAFEPSERAFDDIANRHCVGHAEGFGVERFGIPLEQIGDLAGVANGSDDAVAPIEELFGKLAAEAAVDAGDEPRAL